MNISQLKALFTSIDINKDNSISAEEMKKAPCNSIFSGYFKGSSSLDFETFSTKMNSGEKQNGQKTASQDTSQREVPYEQQNSVKFTKTPSNPESFQWFTSWGENGEQLVGNDASSLDLTKSEKLLQASDFDNNTKFPQKEKLPEGYNPEQILENGKDPGLGLKKLHEQGFTGKGVNVAIIDTPMTTNHDEFSDNIPNYQEVGIAKNQVAEMHGMAVTSIVAGKNVGVAPEAKVNYYAANAGGGNNKNRVTALKEILAKNETLPDDKKVQAVSMSWGITTSDPNYKEFSETVKKLEDKGVFVLYCQVPYPHDFQFEGLTRDSKKDPNDPKSYKLTNAVSQQIGEENFAQGSGGNALLVPSSNKTIAGQAGKDNYVNYSDGGSSWQAPYIMGVYALAKQANPKLTPDEFRQKSLETGTPYYTPEGKLAGKIINPEKLIEELTKGK